MANFLFLGSKITVDGDCSHEIKRCLLLGRKAVTNLDSILKSRDITLLTKVRIVRSMIFPTVTYICDSWIIKKTWALKNWFFLIVVLERRFLRVPTTARRWNQSIAKEINPECSLQGMMLKLKLQYFGHLMQRADSLEESLMLKKIENRGERDGKGMKMVGCHHQLNEHEFEQTLGDSKLLACCSPWGHKESVTT